MLTHPTLDKLQTLRLTGMRQALEEQMHMPDIGELGFEERMGLLVDREYTERETRRLRTRLSKAKLRHNASPEDIDYRTPRGLDKSLMTKLATCGWLREHLNCLIIGPTGIGKSWLACALAQKACRDCGWPFSSGMGGRFPPGWACRSVSSRKSERQSRSSPPTTPPW